LRAGLFDRVGLVRQELVILKKKKNYVQFFDTGKSH